MGSPVKAWQRTILTEDRACVMVVETQGDEPLPLQPEIDRFLRSFKPTGAPKHQ